MAEPNEQLSMNFAGAVKLALSQLYHLPKLQEIAQSDPFQKLLISTGESSGQALRRLLIAAIEELNPGDDIFFRSPRARLYNLLQLHFIERMTIQECIIELGISERQAYRDLKQGTDSISEILWVTLQTKRRRESTSEVVDVVTQHKMLDLAQLIQQAGAAIQPLLAKKSLNLQMEVAPFLLNLDQMLAENILVNLLSYAAHDACQDLTLRLSISKVGADVLIHWESDAPVALETAAPDLFNLAESLRWRLEERLDGKQHDIRLSVLGNGARVLIIDDNEGLLELLSRHLTEQNCRVMTALDAQTGFDLLLSNQPDVVILDVMMPQTSGWDLLQRLKNNLKTSAIPIVICSIYNNPELAYALGASAFVAKPVEREAIIDVLFSLGIL